MQNLRFFGHWREDWFRESSSEISDAGRACLWWCLGLLEGGPGLLEGGPDLYWRQNPSSCAQRRSLIVAGVLSGRPSNGVDSICAGNDVTGVNGNVDMPPCTRVLGGLTHSSYRGLTHSSLEVHVLLVFVATTYHYPYHMGYHTLNERRSSWLVTLNINVSSVKRRFEIWCCPKTHLLPKILTRNSHLLPLQSSTQVSITLTKKKKRRNDPIVANLENYWKTQLGNHSSK